MGTCKFCKSDIEEIDYKCIECGCPKFLEPGDERRWNAGKGYFEPRKPSVLVGKGGQDTLVHCLNCSLLLYLGERECPHCGYVFSKNEIRVLEERHCSSEKNGKFYGALFISVFIVISLLTGFANLIENLF